MEDDPLVICRLKAGEATEEFLKKHKANIVRRLPNGDIMLQFRQSELRKVPE